MVRHRKYDQDIELEWTSPRIGEETVANGRQYSQYTSVSSKHGGAKTVNYKIGDCVFYYETDDDPTTRSDSYYEGVIVELFESEGPMRVNGSFWQNMQAKVHKFHNIEGPKVCTSHLSSFCVLPTDLVH